MSNEVRSRIDQEDDLSRVDVTIRNISDIKNDVDDPKLSINDASVVTDAAIYFIGGILTPILQASAAFFLSAVIDETKRNKNKTKLDKIKNHFTTSIGMHFCDEDYMPKLAAFIYNKNVSLKSLVESINKGLNLFTDFKI